MYTLINKNAALVIDSIAQKHVEDYDFLIANIGSCNTVNYQKKFKHFWKINVARPNQKFVNYYFNLLHQLLEGEDFLLQDIALKLYKTKLNSRGTHTLQFSLSTKMLHVVNTKLPIYDSMVRDFYFFKEPNKEQPIETRLKPFMDFYNFLSTEYDRILKEHLLEETIQLFIEKRKPSHFTNEKIIDTIIWGFVNCLKKRYFINPNFKYS
ncbi:MAG: hypothetical protein AB8E82_19695 [Aureispira sp.]